MNLKEFLVYVCVGSDPNSPLLTSRQLLALCCNFIELDLESNVFRFAHLSVREYLESKTAYHRERVNLFAYMACVKLYSPEGLEFASKIIPSDVTDASLETKLREHRKYANVYWPMHFKLLSSETRTELSTDIIRMCISEREESLWMKDARVYRTDREMIFHTSSPSLFLLCCSFGLPELLATLCASRTDKWDEKGPQKESGLRIAVREGHLEVVRLLVEYGYDCDEQDSGGLTLAHEAVLTQYSQMLDYLIEVRFLNPCVPMDVISNPFASPNSVM